MAMARPYLLHTFERTGAANAVMGVLLDFRAYDTLGEATVIFTSIIGAYVLLRHVGRKPDAGHDTHR
jgi:multisubunit Na+/H+ antiporter MnhB subunit